MNVRMLTHYSRAVDANGLNVIRYVAGQKYDLPESEARLFIEIGVAMEDKDMGRAPETKDERVWENDSEYPFSVLVDAPDKSIKKEKRRRR